MTSQDRRLLLLVDGLWVGGTERSLVELFPHLEAAGWEVSFACLRRRGRGVEDAVPAEQLHLLDGPSLASQIRSLQRLVRALRPAVVHASLYRSCLVSRLAGPGRGSVLVNSLVNTPYEPVRLADPRLTAWHIHLVRLLDAITGRLAVDHFHAVSESVKRSAVERLGLPAERITVVRRGRDPERLGEPSAERRRRARHRLDLADGAPVILNLGRQDYQKGQEHLVRAVATLAPLHPGLVLLLAGREGSRSAALRELANALGVGERVRHLGHRFDAPELLAAADVFAFPSRFEGLPGAVIEAMALALPVVASDIPPNRELVEPGSTGFLVPPEDTAGYTAALDRLLADPALATKLGRRGREAFEASLTIERSARLWVEMYRRIM